MSFASGRHFSQIPGPGKIPDSILRGIAWPVINRFSPDAAALDRELRARREQIFKIDGHET